MFVCYIQFVRESLLMTPTLIVSIMLFFHMHVYIYDYRFTDTLFEQYDNINPYTPPTHLYC